MEPIDEKTTTYEGDSIKFHNFRKIEVFSRQIKEDSLDIACFRSICLKNKEFFNEFDEKIKSITH